MRILFLFLSVMLAAVPAFANFCDQDWLETASGSAVRSLLRSGADVNEMCNVNRNRPLHQAILTPAVDPEVVEVLVNAGGDILAENIDGSSVLDYAERRFSLAERNFSPGSSAYRREERILRSINRLLESNTASATSDQAVNCEEWNTYEFFETATASAVRACLAAGVDVAARNEARSNNTPLHWAASSSDPDPAVMEALLAAGAPLEAREEYGRTPLHYATNLAAVEVLLAAGADIAARSEDEESPLHLAAWLMRPAVVEALVAAGADIDARMADGKTPLHAAASTAAYYEPPLPEHMIQALLDAGANPTPRDAEGKTPWDLVQGNEVLYGLAPAPVRAARAERLANERLQRCEAWNTYEFFETATASAVRACLAAGADVAARNEARSNNTPLHWAASSSDPDPAVMEALLAAGAPLEAREEYGRTPLHYATNLAAVEVLLAAGADIAARSEDEESPLHLAAWLMRPAVVEALVAAGADIDARMADGKTPLHAAASTAAYYEPPLPEHTIQALLDAGANPTPRDAEGKTPWDLVQGNEVLYGLAPAPVRAARAERLANERLQRCEAWNTDEFFETATASAVRACLAAGADVAARDPYGKTPLHLAASMPSPDTIQALLNAGANPSARDAEGKVPWDIARWNEALHGSQAYERLLAAKNAILRLRAAHLAEGFAAQVAERERREVAARRERAERERRAAIDLQRARPTLYPHYSFWTTPARSRRPMR